ncbi:MAG: preprotein translocase subunit SecY [Bdellovibrionaceae bacterium]|nr:preprotein translocase subunit SecY [Pseudobdellovibrionaceae bacterium]MBX3032411.1 preprotein translocase subunit SecY [Pseudobdellovibrionaceae bacterium]
MSAIESISKNSELRKRILFTLAMLAIYRIGVHIPTPGVDSSAVLSFFQAQSRGIFGLFDTFSGGALSQFSIFALGIMPYISASIIFQLLTSAIPYLEQLKKEGEQGRRKINQYTRYATVALALVQGYGISTFLMNQPSPDGRPLVISPTVGFLPFQVMTVITLTAGTCFIMWLGEQITERGIGNGSSLIIFTGIAAAIPAGAKQIFELVSHGEMRFLVALLLVAFMIAVIAGVIFMEVAQRRVPIQYSQRPQMGPQAMSAPQSHLPIKINFSGVIPPIFASSLLMFPATMAQFVQTPWIRAMQDSLNPNGVLFNILFVALIVFFAFFYTEIVFNPNEVSDNLKKYGGFIPGVRAGKSTSEYIQRVLDRVNVLGCIYLCTVCVLPGILTNQFGIPFHFGGTSLLILVGVALDTAQQIQSHVITQKYEGFLKGAKVRSRRVQF